MNLIELYKSDSNRGTLFRWLCNIAGFILLIVVMARIFNPKPSGYLRGDQTTAEIIELNS